IPCRLFQSATLPDSPLPVRNDDVSKPLATHEWRPPCLQAPPVFPHTSSACFHTRAADFLSPLFQERASLHSGGPTAAGIVHNARSHPCPPNRVQARANTPSQHRPACPAQK